MYYKNILITQDTNYSIISNLNKSDNLFYSSVYKNIKVQSSKL